MRNIFLILVGTLLLAACNPSSGSNDQTQPYQDDRKKQTENSQPIVGTYAGEIAAYKLSKNSDTPSEYVLVKIPLEIGIYTEDVPNGKDNDGKTKLYPTLRIRYRQKDAIRDDLILDSVRYDSETRYLDAATANGSTTLRAAIKGNELSGEIIRNGGKLGNFSLSLISKEPLVPYGDAGSILYERTAALYREISGLYIGVVTPPKEGAIQAAFPVQMQLSFMPISVNGVSTARLKATYKRLDIPEASLTERLLDVSYRLDTSPAEMVMSSDGSSPQIPNMYFMSLSGFFESDTYTADLYDRRGFIGVLKVTRKTE